MGFVSIRDFNRVKAIFHLCEQTMKNDPELGKWLVKRGAALMLLGAEELKNPVRFIKR